MKKNISFLLFLFFVYSLAIIQMASAGPRSNPGDLHTSNTAHKFDLTQNYPNPFNPTTTIEYSIVEKSHVTLRIFDILGKEVATLIDEEINAGTYIIHWDASKFSSGTYFYKLSDGKSVETKRMILIK